MQYSNEELAIKIQEGQGDLVPILWDQVQAFVRSEAARWLRAWQSSRPTLEFDDLYQWGYIAMCEAMETYQPDKGAMFLTWFDKYLKTAFSCEVGCRTARQMREGNTPTLSLDMPLDREAGENALGDVVADPEDKYAGAEADLYHEQLKTVVGEALGTLPQAERDVLRLRYWEGMTLRQTGESIHKGAERVRQMENKAMRKLRSGSTGADLREAYFGDRNYFRNTSLQAWRLHGCSSPEWELLWKEREERRQRSDPQKYPKVDMIG